MAKSVVFDARIEINSVNLSDHCRTLALESSRDEVDLTSMGASYREMAAGLADATITATFFQDFAAGSVHATLQPLYDAPNTPFNVKLRPTFAAISATNPEFTMSARLFNYSPLNATVGEASTMDLTFRNASQAGVTVATS